jgi:hypothetical protein
MHDTNPGGLDRYSDVSTNFTDDVANRASMGINEELYEQILEPSRHGSIDVHV